MYHVGAGYIFLFFALLQIVDVVFPALNFADWADTLVVVVGLAGFPIALLLAWIYELTPRAPGRRRRSCSATTINSCGGAGMGLAGYLLIWSVGFGLWKDAYWKGLLALAVGFAVTALALGALPYVRFPNDQYPPEALWIMGSIMVLPITWAAFTLAGRWFLKRPLLHA